ncbi:MAG: NAD(P)-dependent alcohol dehydrogenase [Nitrospiraceae bacterium]|nr:NAD(P)-dependent alcohol dehydrogenase [Nitrospiraceae bacterium]
MNVFEIRDPGLITSLRPASRETPVPGPGQVVVEMKAASLNFRDLLVLKGQYPNLRLPVIPLSDGAGMVTATGPGVSRVELGDRVAGIFNQNWIDGPPPRRALALGGDRDGVLSEQLLLPEEGVVKIPPSLSFEEAATLPCAAVTAWNALFVSGQLRPGQTVLVLGTGGVSLFALQFAKMAGARVIVTSSSDSKLEKAARLGADEGINYRTRPEWEKEVLARTDGEGVDHTIEVGGAGTLSRSLACTRPGGHVAVIGVLTGGQAEIPVFPLLSKQLRLQGVYVGSRAHFEAMLGAIVQNGLHPVIDRVLPFAEAPEAFRALEQGNFTGKICLRF